MDIIWYTVIGSAAGLLGALVGLGGGIIMVPALTLFMNVDVKFAIGASLIAMIATSVMSSAVYARRALVNFDLGIRFVATTVTGSFLGSTLGVRLDGAVLMTVFAGAMIAASYGMLRRSFQSPGHATAVFPGDAGRTGSSVISGEFEGMRYPVRNVPPALGLSFLSGGLSGMLGIGGGIVQVPMFHLLCGVPLKVATATSSYMIAFTGLAGAMVFFVHGKLDSVMTSGLVVGVAAGSYVGARLARRISSRVIGLIFVAVMIVTAIRLILKAVPL